FLVHQRDREPVDLRLGHELVGLLPDQPAEALGPRLELGVVSGVRERQHRLEMLHLGESAPRDDADPLRGRVGRDEARVVGLERAQLAHEVVVLPVRERRLVEDVVPVVRLGDRSPELRCTLRRVFPTHVRTIVGEPRGVDAVTGAFSYTGSVIARELLARDRSVRTLTRSPAPPGHALAGAVRVAPLDPDDEAGLVRALDGTEVLYNTFWIRFPRGGSTFEWAVAASARLFRAAAAAGVERIVHISVTRPSLASPYAYFRAKAAVDELALAGPVPATVVRPPRAVAGRQG